MKKSVLFAIAISVPLALIGIRETIRTIEGIVDPARARPYSALWVLLVLAVLTLVWASVLMIHRASPELRPGKLPFEAAAAIVLNEARKRPPARKCEKCGRAQVIESAPKCLYCGEDFPALPPPAEGLPNLPPGMRNVEK